MSAHRRRTWQDTAADVLYAFLVVSSLLIIVGAPLYLMVTQP